MQKNFWHAVFLLSGTTIGAGIFGIPYATAQVGYWRGFLWLFALSLLTLTMNIAYAIVVLRSRQEKESQFVGYAYEYLGQWGKRIGGMILLLGQWGSMLAYIIGIGSFLAVLLNLPESEMLMSVTAFALVGLATWFRVRMIAAMEGWLVLGMILVVALIVVNGLGYVDVINIKSTPVDIPWRLLLMPYGVMLNALGGAVVISEMFQVLGSNKNINIKSQLIKAVTIGTMVPVLVYFAFQFVVVGVSGNSTSQEAIQGLVAFLNEGVVRLGVLFGLFAMLSSYLTNAYVLKDSFMDDFNYPRFRAWLFANLPPFLIYIAGLKSFIVAVEVSGLWIGTLSMGIIFLMYFRLRTRSY